MCQMCGYTCKKVPLYEVSKKAGPGRKAATANDRLQVGLMGSPIANTGIRKILLTTGIPAPATSGMQKCANNIGQAIVKLNKEDMAAQLDHVNSVKHLRGATADTALPVEGDARYNNPLWSASGKTPFQPATQITYTICENVTAKKKILSVYTGNKLCKTAERQRNKGLIVNCPEHDGHCSANIQPGATIGDERSASMKCMEGQKFTVSHFTSDGDSKGHHGIEMTQHEPVDHLIDIRHLCGGMKKKIGNTAFSATMFPGKIKI
ncbi:uncharacterized protein LOC144346282 [Saccoglossus kowalevskii]